jgi:transketolase
MILAHTVMGKGVPFMEHKEKYHGSTLNEKHLAEALAILGLPNNLETMIIKRAAFTPIPHHRKLEFEPQIETGNSRVYDKATDNRSAWGNAIADLAKLNVNSFTPLAVFDCDLQGSVKTVDFAEIAPHAFFQSGIMEHNTAVMAGAMSTVNMQVFWAEFGVFGIDETYNMHRLNDINRANLKLITTHVGIDVGEDGKTHQCIDYVGLMRNLYHFKVIVPADANQTDRATRWAATQYGNILIAMGRSKLDVLSNTDGSLFYDENYEFQYGKADMLRNGDTAALLVMGTPAGNALKVTEILAKEGIHLQLWNVASPLEPDTEMLQKAAATGMIFTYEDHNPHTGLASQVIAKLNELRLFVPVIPFGVEDYACSGSSEDVFKYCKLDIESVANRIRTALTSR